LEKGKALLKKDNLLDEELAEKIERTHKPLTEKLDYFQSSNNFDQLIEKLEVKYAQFLDFLKENQTILEEMELKIDLTKY
jgi:hypothetical protein